MYIDAGDGVSEHMHVVLEGTSVRRWIRSNKQTQISSSSLHPLSVSEIENRRSIANVQVGTVMLCSESSLDQNIQIIALGAM